MRCQGERLRWSQEIGRSLAAARKESAIVRATNTFVHSFVTATPNHCITALPCLMALGSRQISRTSRHCRSYFCNIMRYLLCCVSFRFIHSFIVESRYLCNPQLINTKSHNFSSLIHKVWWQWKCTIATIAIGGPRTLTRVRVHSAGLENLICSFHTASTERRRTLDLCYKRQHAPGV